MVGCIRHIAEPVYKVQDIVHIVPGLFHIAERQQSEIGEISVPIEHILEDTFNARHTIWLRHGYTSQSVCITVPDRKRHLP